jgi:hypothetical protein
MTPKQITTLDVKELKEIEIKCACGASVRLLLPLKNQWPFEHACRACPRNLWENGSPAVTKIMNLVSAVDDWAKAGYDCVALKFVLSENAVQTKPTPQLDQVI